jgi:hypothetical protein
MSSYTQSNQIFDQLLSSELAVYSVSIIHLKVVNVSSRLDNLIGKESQRPAVDGPQYRMMTLARYSNTKTFRIRRWCRVASETAWCQSRFLEARFPSILRSTSLLQFRRQSCNHVFQVCRTDQPCVFERPYCGPDILKGANNRMASLFSSLGLTGPNKIQPCVHRAFPDHRYTFNYFHFRGERES